MCYSFGAHGETRLFLQLSNEQLFRNSAPTFNIPFRYLITGVKRAYYHQGSLYQIIEKNYKLVQAYTIHVDQITGGLQISSSTRT